MGNHFHMESSGDCPYLWSCPTSTTFTQGGVSHIDVFLNSKRTNDVISSISKDTILLTLLFFT